VILCSLRPNTTDLRPILMGKWHVCGTIGPIEPNYRN
jgi:hypothetical protein